MEYQHVLTLQNYSKEFHVLSKEYSFSRKKHFVFFSSSFFHNRFWYSCYKCFENNFWYRHCFKNNDVPFLCKISLFYIFNTRWISVTILFFFPLSIFCCNRSEYLIFLTNRYSHLYNAYHRQQLEPFQDLNTWNFRFC